MREQLVRLLGLEGSTSAEEVQQVPLELLHSNPFQPRREFLPEELEELASSIRSHGILQPIVARPASGGFEIVAGERRVRACRILGFATIPAVVKDLEDGEVALLALVENLQREDLNCLEEARGYQRLLEEFGFTQEALAQKVGKNQSTVANKLRLLRLPVEVQNFISRGIITERHARALLKLEKEEHMVPLSELVASQGLTVKALEGKVQELLGNSPDKLPAAGAAAGGKSRSPSARRAGEATPLTAEHQEVKQFRSALWRALRSMERDGVAVEVEEDEGQGWVQFRVKLASEGEQAIEVADT